MGTASVPPGGGPRDQGGSSLVRVTGEGADHPQRLRDERGLSASVASLKRYVAANIAEEVRRGRWWCCATRRTPRPVRRLSWTTGTWATGWTRPPAAGGECGRS